MKLEGSARFAQSYRDIEATILEGTFCWAQKPTLSSAVGLVNSKKISAEAGLLNSERRLCRDKGGLTNAPEAVKGFRFAVCILFPFDGECGWRRRGLFGSNCVVVEVVANRLEFKRVYMDKG